jgi:hypothetical protein
MFRWGILTALATSTAAAWLRVDCPDRVCRMLLTVIALISISVVTISFLRIVAGDDPPRRRGVESD